VLHALEFVAGDYLDKCRNCCLHCSVMTPMGVVGWARGSGMHEISTAPRRGQGLGEGIGRVPSHSVHPARPTGYCRCMTSNTDTGGS